MREERLVWGQTLEGFKGIYRGWSGPDLDAPGGWDFFLPGVSQPLISVERRYEKSNQRWEFLPGVKVDLLQEDKINFRLECVTDWKRMGNFFGTRWFLPKLFGWEPFIFVGTGDRTLSKVTFFVSFPSFYFYVQESIYIIKRKHSISLHN